MKKSVLPCGLAAAFVLHTICFAQPARTIEDTDHLLYLPAGIERAGERPLVIALSPSADAQAMIKTWKKAADRQQWIILASRKFRNNIDCTPVFADIVKTVRRLADELPIDTSRIIVTGFSGGGMGSYSFVYLYPKLVSAVVINTGMMHENLAGRRDIFPRNKLAVFLASPTDFRYDQMQRDRAFLESLGWDTRWTEFPGGHTLAPEQAYREAAAWLAGRLEE